MTTYPILRWTMFEPQNSCLDIDAKSLVENRRQTIPDVTGAVAQSEIF